MNRKVIVKCVSSLPKSITIYYGTIETKFGKVLLGVYLENLKEYICFLHFTHDHIKFQQLTKLVKRWPIATLVENQNLVDEINLKYFLNIDHKQPVAVILNGTRFQQAVWRDLLTIPFGKVRNYSEIAEHIKKPRAVQAVAKAIASNDIAVIIPCHRVVAKTGNPFSYRWGEDVKKSLIEYEKCIKTFIN